MFKRLGRKSRWKREIMNRNIALFGLIVLGLLLFGCAQTPPTVKNQTNITTPVVNETPNLPLANQTNETEMCKAISNQVYDNGNLIKPKCANETATLSPFCDAGILDWKTESCDKDQICMLGECIATPVNTLCVDSDRGKNLTVAGYVTFQGETFYDKCEGKNIKEYYCQNDGVQVSMVSCPDYYKCDNGACVPVKTACTQKGGYVQIDFPNGYGEKHYNYCSDNQKFMVKYGCDGENYTQYTVDCMPDEYCPKGNDTCQQRYCEGMNKMNMSYPLQFKPTFVTYGPDTYYSRCDDNRTLKTYYCSPTRTVTFDKITCTCTRTQRDIYNPYSDKTITVSAGYCD
jgi:hypothetical protein